MHDSPDLASLTSLAIVRLYNLRAIMLTCVYRYVELYLPIFLEIIAVIQYVKQITTASNQQTHWYGKAHIAAASTAAYVHKRPYAARRQSYNGTYLSTRLALSVAPSTSCI